MRKLLATVMAAGLMFGGAVVANAAPGPNDHNNHGLCTAFFNGKKKGHDKDGSGHPPPFQQLIDDADDGDSGTPIEEDVFNFCSNVDIGGNPEKGRYPELFEEG